jgi:membrane-associated phospholipid phosphatase
MASIGLARLKSEILKIEPLPIIDRRALPVYALVAVAATIVALGFLLFDFHLASSRPFDLGLLCMSFIVPGLAARRIRLIRISAALQILGLIFLIGLLAQMGSILISAWSRADIDPWLSRADYALGFDWPALAAFMARHPMILDANQLAYRAISWQPAVLIGMLLFAKSQDRFWTFVTAWGICLAITVAIYPLAPAQGAFLFYGISHESMPGLATNDPWKFGPIISGLRDGSIRSITTEIFTGLVSIPSFHAASAVLYAWVLWGNRWLRYPFLVLNICMGLSALINGGHYLVDLIAGCAVAALSIWLARIAVRKQASSIAPGPEHHR